MEKREVDYQSVMKWWVVSGLRYANLKDILGLVNMSFSLELFSKDNEGGKKNTTMELRPKEAGVCSRQCEVTVTTSVTV